MDYADQQLDTARWERWEDKSVFNKPVLELSLQSKRLNEANKDCQIDLQGQEELKQEVK